MELLAVEMKERGYYISRQISYEGVDFHTITVEKNEQFNAMYKECSEMVNIFFFIKLSVKNTRSLLDAHICMPFFSGA